MATVHKFHISENETGSKLVDVSGINIFRDERPKLSKDEIKIRTRKRKQQSQKN